MSMDNNSKGRSVTKHRNAIAIGLNSGIFDQSENAIAIGNQAGETKQNEKSIAIGRGAAQIDQSANAIAIGNGAGSLRQGQYAIAIGNLAGAIDQSNNSIILNSNATQLNGAGSGFYVQPIRNDITLNNLYYNTSTKEIVYYQPSQLRSIFFMKQTAGFVRNTLKEINFDSENTRLYGLENLDFIKENELATTSSLNFNKLQEMGFKSGIIDLNVNLIHYELASGSSTNINFVLKNEDDDELYLGNIKSVTDNGLRQP